MHPRNTIDEMKRKRSEERSLEIVMEKITIMMNEQKNIHEKINAIYQTICDNQLQLTQLKDKALEKDAQMTALNEQLKEIKNIAATTSTTSTTSKSTEQTPALRRRQQYNTIAKNGAMTKESKPTQSKVHQISNKKKVAKKMGLGGDSAEIPTKPKKDISKCTRRAVITVFNPTTKADNIKRHLDSKKIDVKDVLTINNLSKNRRKFIIVSDGEHFDQILDQENWPSHVKIEHFVFNNHSIELFKKCQSLNEMDTSESL
ncbi:hypothetical protein SNEBB_003682 [Seison nebaliae]|nr:hypothetical protein SNEBB_003682 [Seison nebaliae]